VQRPLLIRILVNVNARRAARQPRLVARLRTIVGRHGDVAETRNPSDLVRAVDACRFDRVDLVAVCGGDGTYTRVLTTLAARYGVDPYPSLAFLPGGTVNTIARNFGVVGRPEEVLQRLVRRIDDGCIDASLRPTKTLRIGDGLGFVFGAALAGKFYEAYYRGGGAGLPKAARLLSRIVGGAMVGRPFAKQVLEPIECDVTVDGKKLATRHFSLLVAGTVPSVGLGIRVLPRFDEDLHTFQFVATGETLRRLAVQIQRVWRGAGLVGPTTTDALARTVDLRFAAPSPCVIDGEMVVERHVRLRLGPTFRLACP
jgi:diacylglycerol kinase family enzyme